MPTIHRPGPKAQPRKKPVAETLTDAQPVRRRTGKKAVSINGIIGNTISDRLSDGISKTVSLRMVQTVGENYAIQPKEAYNIIHPATRIVRHYLPPINIESKVDAEILEDIKLMVASVVEYGLRIMNTWLNIKLLTLQKVKLAQQMGIPPNVAARMQLIQREGKIMLVMPNEQPRYESVPTPATEPLPDTDDTDDTEEAEGIPENVPSDESFDLSLDGQDMGDDLSSYIAESGLPIEPLPMRATGLNLAEAVSNGFIAGDMGQMVGQ